MKKLFFAFALLCAQTIYAQYEYKFTTIKENPATSVKNQARTGTCWCFATTSFMESELLRMGKRANFELANKKATEEEIWAALEAVNLSDFIKGNGGLDKVITEDANNVSGGQKQRLALAVNLVADKDIYVFDEATSNIDIESEAIIMDNIKSMSKNKSVIVISHRLANVVPADNIYYMEEGEVKEHGSHAELMSTQGGYAKLFNTQKALEEGYKEITGVTAEVRA